MATDRSSDQEIVVTPDFGWSAVETALIRLGDALERPASLTLIGSAVSMSLGQPGRMTMDVDVWKRTSKFDLGDIKRACEKAEIHFNPSAYDHPDHLYIQMIDPGLVRLGEFDETVEIAHMGNLTIRRPPLENIIASKLIRGDARDFDDIVFLIAKCGVTRAQIESAAETIDDMMSRETAQENLVMLDVALNMRTPPAPRNHSPRPCP